MERNIVGMASLTGAAFVVLVWSTYRVHAADREALEVLQARVEGLAGDPVAPSPEPDSASIAELEKTMEQLSLRLARLETAPQRIAVVNTASEPQAGSELEAAETPAEVDGPDDAVRGEFEELLTQLAESGWDYTELGEDYQRFLELARETGLLDELIAGIEGRVAAAPHDVDGRMELADAYVARLMTVAGPEQGLWGNRAEEQWLAVVDLDDEHWSAHSSLGTNYSYYPEVMGKRDTAIQHLERAREIQRNLTPAPEHIQTYLFLARMYEQAIQPDRAREVLVEGLQAHPGDSQLEAALASVE